MTWFVFLAWGLAVCAAVTAFVPQSKARRRQRGVRLAGRYLLRIEQADVVGFDAGMDGARRRRYLVGAVALAVLGPAYAAVARSTGLEDNLGSLTLWLGVVGAAWLANLVAELGPRLLRGSGPRSARTRSVGVADFVHPVPRLVLVGGAGLGLLAAWSLWRDGAGAGEWLLPLATLAVLAACEGFARLMTGLPQPASTPGELYLRDALRSEAITDAYGQGVFISSVMVGISFADGPELVVVLGAGWLLLGVALSVLMLALGRESYLRFRERLWPDLPPAAVVSTSAEAMPA